MRSRALLWRLVRWAGKAKARAWCRLGLHQWTPARFGRLCRNCRAAEWYY
jgi:hypothetical protein